MHPVVVIQTQLYLEMAMEVLASIVNLWRGTRTYTYGDSDWRDLLTAYDAIGNPTSYYNGTRWTMSWVNGRSLATASDGSNRLSFAYDAICSTSS